MAYSIEKTSSVTASDIITTADLKGHLRVDHSDEDTLIEALRGAAIEYCENYCNISLGDVTAVMYLDRFFATWEIPVGPVVSIESITWNISADTTETLDTGNYYVDVKRSPARVSIINAPQVYDYVHNGVQVNFTYGYPEASIPTAIKHAIRLLVAHWYENRRQVIQANSYEVPMGVHALLNTYRIER